MDLHRQLMGHIHSIDKLVFPGKSLSVVPIDKRSLNSRAQIAFASTGNPETDHYRVYLPGLEEYFRGTLAVRMHVMFDPLDPFYMFARPMPFSWLECVVGIAIHEVRHRVQYHLGVKLISSNHIAQVERCRYWGKTQDQFFRSVDLGDDTPLEYDALFIEAYGAYELRRGRLKTERDMRVLLMLTPEQFLKVEQDRAAF